MEFSQIGTGWAFNECGSNPRVEHDKFDLKIFSDVRSPYSTILVKLFNLCWEIEFFSDIEESFFMINTLSMIAHAFNSNNTSSVKNPVDDILSCLFVSELSFREGLIAEKVKGACKNGTSIVKSLHTGSESDGSTCFDCSFCLLIFGESCCFGSNQIVELIVLVVDEVEADSFIEKWFFALILREEGCNGFIIECWDDGWGSMVAEVVFEFCSSFFEFNTEGIEKFAVREGGINISDDDDVSSLIEVGDDVFAFDFAFYFWVDSVLHLAEVAMTTMCS